MRVLLCALAAAVIFAGCGGGSKRATTPTTGAKSPTAVQTPAAKPTPSTAATCPTPPAGPPSSLAYTAPATSPLQNTLGGLQVTTSACSDTATFTFVGPGLPAYEAKYVPAASGCGSGLPISTAGTAQLTLRLEPAVAHDQNGNATVPFSQTPGYASMKELKSTCDFEGVVEWVTGTEPRYYTVTTAQSPSRIIVEVYH